MTCKVGVACDQTPKPETEFYWLKRDKRRDYGCKACRRHQQNERRRRSGRTQGKRDVYYRGWSALAQAFCLAPPPRLEES